MVITIKNVLNNRHKRLQSVSLALMLDVLTFCKDVIETISLEITKTKQELDTKLKTTSVKKLTLPKICHTYPAMMKLGTVIPYLKKILKYINHVPHPLSSADISIFSVEIKKDRCRLHFKI